MKSWDVRVIDITDSKPILFKVDGLDTWVASAQAHDQSFETQISPEQAYRLALDLLRAAARVGVTVRD